MSPIDVPRASSLWQRALVVSFCACTVYPATTAVAQVSRLAPAGPPVEIVDPSERISGNATPGLVIVHEGDKIGADRLWAYLSEPVAANLKLRISSIDGRYYAEIDYATDSRTAGWVALDLSLRSFSFLESNYTDPLNQIAAVLSDADARLYPLRWTVPHRGVTTPPPPPKDTDPLRIYMNTERATAFVVVDGQPSYCRDASEVSGFKFNAICDVALGALRLPADAGAPNVVEGISVLRRQGVRTLAPLKVDVRIRY